MKTRCLALLAVGLLLAADDPKAAGKKDLDQLQGTWTAARVEYNGEKADGDVVKGLKVVIDGDKMTVQAESPDLEKYGKMALKLDATTAPKLMDITVTAGDEKGTTFEAIYAVDKDQWKLCLKPFAKERPAKFETSAGGNEVLVVFEREKK
jgi:uncharacterized protein (TIGR03067 family)